MKDRLLHFILADEALHPAFPRHFVIQASFETYIMVFEIDRLQPRIAPRQAFGFAHRLEQELLGYPVDAVFAQPVIAREIVERSLPLAQSPDSVFVRFAVLLRGGEI